MCRSHLGGFAHETAICAPVPSRAFPAPPIYTLTLTPGHTCAHTHTLIHMYSHTYTGRNSHLDNYKPAQTHSHSFTHSDSQIHTHTHRYTYIPCHTFVFSDVDTCSHSQLYTGTHTTRLPSPAFCVLSCQIGKAVNLN